MGQIYHASTDCIAQFLPNMSSDVVHFKFNSVPRRVQGLFPGIPSPTVGTDTPTGTKI